MTQQPVFPRLHDRLQMAIAKQLNWDALRPVQDMSGHVLLNGDNAVILAPTAGGKTEAVMFPALSMLCAQPTDSVGVLYIAPIKALLNNQAQRLELYTSMVGLRRFVWHGDVKQSARRKFLEEPTEVLMTTPESLEVMLMSSKISIKKLFGDLRMVVIDEVHVLAGADRGAHLLSVIERIALSSEHDVQRVGLSATVGNPNDIAKWIQGSSLRPSTVVDPPHAPSNKALLIVMREVFETLAHDAATIGQRSKSLLFCQSRSMTEAAANAMQGRDIKVFVHHSSVSAQERERAESTFTKKGLAACIVCTSTLELGIDIGDLDKVLQVDTTSTVSAFLQRLGRTGRRPDTTANTTFLCSTPDAVIQACAILDLARRGWVEDVSVNRRCWSVLAHQIMAMSLATGGLDPARAFDVLSKVTDFSGVTAQEYAMLIDHIIETGFLYRTSGLLVMGDKGERVFGRKNFMEMYAVFSSPQLFIVETIAGRELGSLEQSFVDDLMEGDSTFVLAGRRWQVERINLKERRIKVIPSTSGKKPSWGGWAPQHLSYTLCQQIKVVLSDSTSASYLHETAELALNARRHEMSVIFEEDDGVFLEDDQLTWWTFAGGRINRTLRGILALDGWQVTHDNLKLTCTRLDESISLTMAWSRTMSRLRCAETWDVNASIWAEIVKTLPKFRLSKFQRVLPQWAVDEMLSTFLLDVSGAQYFVEAHL